MNSITERIKIAPETSFQPAVGIASEKDGLAANLPPELWEQVSWLFGEIDDVRLFSGDPARKPRPNSWFLDSGFLPANMLESTIGSPVGLPCDYLANYRMLGSWWWTGDWLAIGASDECLGKIAVVYTQICSEYGNVPVIAGSLREFLERVLEDGPECEYPYWQRRGFVELGSAIPGDSLYESPIAD